MKTSIAIYVKDQNVLVKLKEMAEIHSVSVIVAPEPTLVEKGYYVVCDKESFLETTETFKAVPGQQLYVLSDGTDEENLNFIQSYGIHHLIGLNEGVFSEELVGHVQKSSSGKIWGLDPYMAEDAVVKILSLSDSRNTNELVDDALKSFDFQEYFSSPTEYIQVMANELISNSLYKGPNKRRNEQGLGSPDRKSPVFLKGAELVQVTLGMDQKGVALSVQDSFGGLTYEGLLASLLRSFRDKTALDKKDGAGLGLYLTYLHSNQFIVNTKKDFRTEVICIIEKNKRYKNYKQRIRSFHFFQEVASEKTNH